MKKSTVLILILFPAIYMALISQSLMPKLNTHIQVDRADTRFNLYIMESTYRFLFAKNWPQKDLWTLPMLYPSKNNLAYSHNLFGQQLIYSPLRLVGLSPIQSFNTWMLLTFLLNFYCAFFAARYFIKNDWGALLTAFLFAFGPQRASLLHHIQVHQTFFFPLFIMFFHKHILNRQSAIWKGIGLTVLCFIGTFYSSLYLGYFSILITLIFAIVWLFQNKPFRKDYNTIIFWKKAVIFTIFVMLLLIPLLLPYYNVSKEFGTRKIQETYHFTPKFGDFFRPIHGTLVKKVFQVKSTMGDKRGSFITNVVTFYLIAGSLLILFLAIIKRLRKIDFEKRLSENPFFPIIALAVPLLILFYSQPKPSFYWLYAVGLAVFLYFVVFRPRPVQFSGLEPSDQKTATLFLITSFICLIAMVRWDRILSPVWLFGYYTIPGFSAIRVPTRLVMLLVFPAAISLFLSIRQKMVTWVYIVLSLLFVFESFRILQINDARPPYQDFFRKFGKMKGASGPVGVLPFGNPIRKPHPQESVSWPYWTLDIMFGQLHFRKQIINGYSGFLPDWHRNLIDLSNRKMLSTMAATNIFLQLSRRAKTMVIFRELLNPITGTIFVEMARKKYKSVRIYRNGKIHVYY